MSYHVAIYRRAFWLPDAPTLQQILQTLVGAPPWSASLGTAEAASVGSAELVASLIEEELAGPPRLLPADLQRVVIAAH